LKWSEVETLFGLGPRERVYITQTDDDKKTTVEFGDGKMGARLPMGRENVKATYRKGIGLEGLVEAGQLSLLMTRPLGVKSVINPQDATGAQDPQSMVDARTNSPITVLTLDRIVSLRDYEDFARSFSGVAKALVTWTWNIDTRGVFITVAGIDGAEIADDSVLHGNLVSAMQKAGDAHVPVTIKSYRSVTFRVVADLKVDPVFIEEKVVAAVEAALRSGFSFEARAFGQPVTLSEVVAVMQNVDGVLAVDINKLYLSDENEELRSFLPADSPGPGDDTSVPAAELLTLDPAPLQLGVMP
jgi:predicted phage baseplate assembly protein